MNIDVINMAGLLMDGKDDGLEASMREHLEPRSLITIAPTPLHAAREHPNVSVERAVAEVQRVMQDIRGRFGDVRALLTGRSYGGLMALLAACRTDFRDILAALAIESPLHPDVTVRAPLLLPPLRICRAHYDARPELCREAADFLKRAEDDAGGKIVMIAGGSEDDVVPLRAQTLPGNMEEIFVDDPDWQSALMQSGKGVAVKLPPALGGRNGGMKKALPEGYRNHLFWSDGKMKAITDVIGAVARVADGRAADGRATNTQRRIIENTV